MDLQQALLLERHVEESESESLSDSFGYSETESLVESVGSVEFDGSGSKPSSLVEVGFGNRARRRKKGRAQFMHFFKELDDVPVQRAWEFVRDHKLMASLVPGIMEGFEYLEGEGGSGSVYIGRYCPEIVKPGEDNYLINKVEVSDDEAKLYAVRCVAGKYLKRYNLYMTYINVLADHVLDNSSIVVWRFEYELVNCDAPAPEDTKMAYMAAMNLVKDRHHSLNRVERPLGSHSVVVNVTKRLRVRPAQQLLTGAEQRELEDRSRHRRRRKGRGQRNDEEGSDRESRTNQRPPRWKASNRVQVAGSGSGLVFRRRLPQLSQQ